MTDRIIPAAVNGHVCISAITCGELETSILKSRDPETDEGQVERIAGFYQNAGKS